MIIQKELLNKVKDFGLNSYEAKLWAALLSRGVSTAGELSDIANVPRSRSYDVLESLEKKGFIIMKLGKPIKYIAVPPSEVIERVKKKVEKDAETQHKFLDKVKNSEIFQELSVLHNQSKVTIDPADLTGVVKGRKNIEHQLTTMLKNTKKSFIVISTDDGVERKRPFMKKHLSRSKDKKVKARVLAPLSKKHKPLAKQLEKFAQVRSIQSPIARFCVSDSKEVLIMILDDKKTHPTYDTAICVSTPFFAKSLENMFNKLWDSARAVK